MDVTMSPGVYVNEVPSGNAPITGVGTSTAAFIGVIPDGPSAPAAAHVVLCTNFTDFKSVFGDFADPATNPWQSTLAHAVYGFFLNGGTRCYVTRVAPSASGPAGLSAALAALEPIDEIAILAAPGLTDPTQYAAITTHCAVTTKNRFAILDTPRDLASDDLSLLTATPINNQTSLLPANTDYAALYFPWIQVFDQASKASLFVPPSGHVAGIYARVDTTRGVHKAPANEVVFDAVDLRYKLSRSQQDGLNPQGVNCIRRVNGNIKVWGARTAGGDTNEASGGFKYLSNRRLFVFLRESIDQGLQWAVFEPNNADLWAKIKRNVGVFLETVWRSGALFGATPAEAFYVKCDTETNPPAVRDAGQVVTEIGVALTKPAEFVVFHLTQKIST